MTRCLFLLLLFAFLPALPQDLRPVAGVAVDGVTGQPLKNIRVLLSPVAKPNSSMIAKTGDDGQFRFDVPKGTYNLRGSRPGLPVQTYGARSLANGLGSAVIVGPDQETGQLVFRLLPPGSISGKVVDTWGEPVESTLVQLFSIRVMGGRRDTQMQASAYTNDLGEYRFGALAAGTYYLSVSGQPWMSQSGLASSVLGAYATVYYPNTADARAAAPLTIKLGQEASANFTLPSTPGFKLTVRSAEQGSSAIRAFVTGEGILGKDGYQRVLSMSGGAQELPALPPGRYKVRLIGMDRDRPLIGEQKVDIVDSDVQVTVPLKSLATVSGSVRLSEQDTPAALTGVFVTIRNEISGQFANQEVAADGTFTIPRVAPGRYRINVFDRSGVFVQSVSTPAGVLADNLLNIADESPQQAELTVTRRSGRVKGFAEQGGKPMPGLSVVLAPVKPSSNAGDYSLFLSDSDGSFDWPAVRPGQYHLFAVNEDDIEYANPQAIQKYLGAAKTITVEPKGVVTENVEAQP